MYVRKSLVILHCLILAILDWWDVLTKITILQGRSFVSFLVLLTSLLYYSCHLILYCWLYGYFFKSAIFSYRQKLYAQHVTFLLKDLFLYYTQALPAILDSNICISKVQESLQTSLSALQETKDDEKSFLLLKSGIIYLISICIVWPQDLLSQSEEESMLPKQISVLCWEKTS